MEDDLYIVLEDDSAVQVARKLIQVFNDVTNGNLMELERLRSSAGIQHGVSQGIDETREGSDEDGDESETTHDMDIDLPTPPMSTKPERIIDDDGFELVQKKGRR